MLGWFDPLYFVFIAPAALLMMWAQYKVKATYHQGMAVDARLTGAAAARHILDVAGLRDVHVEETSGFLSDHYDPGARVLRLSSEVYHTRTATAVGIAAHEAGHALQHANGYLPLIIRNAAVPAATYGPWLFFVMMILGPIFSSPSLLWLGLAGFGWVVFFQVVNLPVEFDASSRARLLLNEHGIVNGEGAKAVSNVLSAAAWTYVAGTLQTILTFLYYAYRIFGATSRDD